MFLWQICFLQNNNYLLNFNNFEKRKYFTKLRICSHDLQIETGRYNKPQKTPVEKRICPYCNMQNIEDEFHFVMECTNYKELRKSFFRSLIMYHTLIVYQITSKNLYG